MRKAFSFYKSHYDQMKLMSNDQKAQLMTAICEVQFLEKSLDEIEFEDQLLNIVWVGIKHSLESSLKGYVAKQKSLNKEVMNPLEGCQNNSMNPLEQEKEKEEEKEEEKGEEEVQDVIVGQSPDVSQSQLRQEIISHLNEVTNSHYKPNAAKTKALIQARLNEGYTLDDFKQVHISKFAEWADTEWEKFLRPETLYSNKFESYLNQKVSDYSKTKAIANHTGMTQLELLKQQGYAG